jgi:DNA-binding CsgD family transcriptional regulator/PAS domain-containing protein
MSSAKFRRAISSIYDAALVPELWPAALQSVMDQLGAVGAGYSLFDRRTERVEWLSQSGSLVGREADYFSYYHELDRYRPILEARPTGEWLQISECLPETVLRRDEWYNDYLLEAGIDDALSVRTFENASHIVVFGVSHGIDQAPFTASGVAVLQAMLEPLAEAARLHVELHNLGWKSSVALRALDQLGAAVIIADSDGRVIQTNRAAERVLQRGDGLRIRNGKLGALDVSESAGLETAIAAAAVEQKTAAAIGRMRVRRHNGRLPYVLTVAPLGADLTVYGRPSAMIVVTDPDECSRSERDLAEFFQLSPAESRLAVALLAGKKLREVAMEFGVQITTLRTQLSSILRKTGVTRQVDLIRLLSNVPVIPEGAPEIKYGR